MFPIQRVLLLDKGSYTPGCRGGALITLLSLGTALGLIPSCCPRFDVGIASACATLALEVKEHTSRNIKWRWPYLISSAF